MVWCAIRKQVSPKPKHDRSSMVERGMEGQGEGVHAIFGNLRSHTAWQSHTRVREIEFWRKLFES
jgi:hypothetical protein